MELTEENVERVLDEVGVLAHKRNRVWEFLTGFRTHVRPPPIGAGRVVAAHSRRTPTMQVRPYLMADGGNAELAEIDGLVVRLKLVGSCGSCPSSTATMTMGIKRRMMERIPVSVGDCAQPGLVRAITMLCCIHLN